ncbi:hypothetical protein R6Q59_030199 [Mikania micrantha]
MMSPEKKPANATGNSTVRDWCCGPAGDTFFRQFCEALVRRKTASFTVSSPEIDQPRTQTTQDKISKKHTLHEVPEIETDESSTMISDEQVCYQVPVFYPFSGEQIPSDTQDIESETSFDQLSSINRLMLPPDFESLLDKNLDHEESFQTEEPGVKFEDENHEVVCDDHAGIYDNIHDTNYKSPKMLKLDYDRIIAGWDNDRSLWFTGDRPEFNPNDRCMVGCGKKCGSGDMGRMTARYDVAREARVSRYREKRRTRLFSKKIRYEVRKLNAEKRPRMKGRFVKTTSVPPVV